MLDMWVDIYPMISYNCTNKEVTHWENMLPYEIHGYINIDLVFNCKFV